MTAIIDGSDTTEIGGDGQRSAFEQLGGLPPGRYNAYAPHSGLKSGNSSPLSKSSITGMGSGTTSQTSTPRRPTLPPTPSFPRGDRNKNNCFIRPRTVALAPSVWFSPTTTTAWTGDSDAILLTAQNITANSRTIDRPNIKQKRFTRPNLRAVSTQSKSLKTGSSRSHPFQAIRQLGASSAPLNDGAEPPLHHLKMENTPGERRYAVHLGDVEGWSFVVQMRRARDSPLYDAAFLCDDLDYWNGSQFVLMPLVDAVILHGSPKTNLITFESGSSGNFIQSFTHNYYTISIAQDKMDHTSPSLNSQSTRTTDGMTWVAEKWRRFASACALYVALGEIGVCDLDSLPFISLYQAKWEVLLGEKSVRLEILSSGVKSSIELLKKFDEKALQQNVPVAVLRPMLRKGQMKNPSVRIVAGANPITVPKMVIQPFADVELFQLFYLQLVFRAFFDIRFPSLYIPLNAALKNANGTTRHVLRADHIGVKCAGNCQIAFEHPTDSSRLLVFPKFSPLLVLLDIASAVVPCYANSQELRETEVLPLIGGSPSDTPCLTNLGSDVLEWASTQEVCGPTPSMRLLCELFELFSPKYEVKKKKMEAGEATAIFYCNELKVFTNLDFKCGDLAKFFSRLDSPSRSSTNVSQTPPPSSSPRFMKNTLRHDILSCSSSMDRVNQSGPQKKEEEQENEVEEAVRGQEEESTPVKVDQTDVMTVTKNELAPVAVPTSEEPLPIERLWRQYISTGNTSIFNGNTDRIEITGFLGRGGSGIVYRGVYNKTTPVAVKMFVLVPGMEHEAYVRECLTDLSFYVLLNQLSDYGICQAGRAHGFVVSNHIPEGVSEEDVKAACRGGDPKETYLCYFLTDLMDGTLGRFLTEADDDFDPFYDTIVNSPLRDAEMFQFLYTQLACKALFNWKFFDLMLNQQLRGDNVGYRNLSVVAKDDATPSLPPRESYDGIFIAFQRNEDAPTEYLKFASDSGVDPLRFIYFIDVGQGIQPNVATLRKNRYIGETMVESCLQDDGFGRYWPMDELYCKYVEVKGEVASEAVKWGSDQKS
ncbi:hypothetical protein AGDE_13489 [Angomonas deanei]|uniref:Protein kinase domain-containing protein n=1 Tax=Angomonas deanei TaxID=59799 RepID=A0A7G2C0E1_9TRYP|nr:hypothetical protein AGDE_13489 [Angomonas deanei]CAD2213126.1 hypothetical protein, conserved [Angomonas deanei]|eukprot:EPY22237.1 hypothetical protein AGDE_13489 [Angomonas deanei]